MKLFLPLGTAKWTSVGSKPIAVGYTLYFFAYFSHWNTQGVKPYVTYTEFGGRDYVKENIAASWCDGYGCKIEPMELIEKFQHLMVYDDANSSWGHRDNILDPHHTHVNIGIVWDNNSFYFVQHFETKLIYYDQVNLEDKILRSSGKTQNGYELKSISTCLGLLSGGIAIYLKEILTNVAGWIYIILRKPFVLGNRIEIDGDMGDVIDIHIFRFAMLEVGNWVDAHQSTGRIIYIPNGKVFTKSLANFHSGFNYIWNELPILVTFESNWKKAKEILEKIISSSVEMVNNSMENQIKDASQKYMIRFEVLTPIVYTSVKDSGVLLTIRYVCEPLKNRSSEQNR